MCNQGLPSPWGIESEVLDRHKPETGSRLRLAPVPRFSFELPQVGEDWNLACGRVQTPGSAECGEFLSPTLTGLVAVAPRDIAPFSNRLVNLRSDF